MKKNKLAPIPMPLKVRWREFRVQALPFLVFLAVVTLTVFLWQEKTAPGVMTGEVEGTTEIVTAPVSGSLAELFVTRFDEVAAGDVVGRVIQTPPEVLHASLAVLRQEIELTRLGWFDPVLDRQRNLLQLEDLRLDLLDRRAGLAIRRIELDRAERADRRYTRLFEQGTVAEEVFEEARERADVLRARVAEDEALIEETERTLEVLGHGEDVERTGVSDAIAATLSWHEERLNLMEAELRPVPLVAPISGTVSEVTRGNRGNVTGGEPVLTIRSATPERIVAYLQPPLAFDPEIGSEVRVRARNASRTEGTGRIVAVGAQIEPLSPALERPFVNIYQSGLPILINLPPTLQVRPGELVDVDLLDR